VPLPSGISVKVGCAAALDAASALTAQNSMKAVIETILDLFIHRVTWLLTTPPSTVVWTSMP
jgi:hypothetical protein